LNNIGLIAGYGKLPILWAKKAKEHGVKIHAFPIKEEYSEELRDYSDTIDYISVTQYNALLNKLKKYNIENIIMIGKVNKKHLYEKKEFDQRFLKLINDTDNREDNSILEKLLAEFKKEGIKVLKQNLFMDDLLVSAGQFNNIKPDDSLLEEMKYAFKKAKQIANYNIGQTVLTNNKAVVAVEAIEGTDQAIKRAGNLVKEGVVMAKVSKKNHDFRFDIPTIGVDTIKNLKSIQAKGLVLESNKIFVIDRDKVKKLANQAELSIISITTEEV